MAMVQGPLLLRHSPPPSPAPEQDADLTPFANIDEIYKIFSEIIGAIALPLGVFCIAACPLGILSWSVGGGVGAGLLALTVITWAVTSSHFREQNEEIETVRQAIARMLAGFPNLENALPQIREAFRENVKQDFWTYVFKNELIKPKGALGFRRLCEVMMDSKDLNMMDVIHWYQKLELERIAAGVPGTNYAVPQPGEFRRKWRVETEKLPLFGISRDGKGVPDDIIHRYDLNLLRHYKILNEDEQKLLETLKTQFDQENDPESLNIQYDTFRNTSSCFAGNS